MYLTRGKVPCGIQSVARSVSRARMQSMPHHTGRLYALIKSKPRVLNR